jgi:hypothetical protein
LVLLATFLGSLIKLLAAAVLLLALLALGFLTAPSRLSLLALLLGLLAVSLLAP